MGKLSVSMNSILDADINKYIKTFKEMKVDRVFMGLTGRGGAFNEPERKAKVFQKYVEKRDLLENHGFETALWISTLGYGGPVADFNHEICKDFTRKVSITGKSHDDCFCPTDENLIETICNFVRYVAKSGTKMLQFDDDLCLSATPGIGCACDTHMERYQKLLGENITREELADKIFTGGKNRYRDVWLKMQGDTLRYFCQRLRDAADEINPKMRMGFCAGGTSFDLEGVDAIELTKILAGNTKPFLRFTGAPYWYTSKKHNIQMLQTVVEITRLQYEWCKNQGVELFTEADSYPHNRFQVPASHVEGFDLATRVAENLDSLKYVMGYFSQPDYEMRYANEHIKHLKLYEEIAKAFDDKEATGIRIYEQMRMVENLELPEKFTDESSIISHWIHNHASAIPISGAIPTTYSGDGICGMAFGEQAKYLPETAFEKGLIIDLRAAEILQEKGIDVGLKSKKLLDYLPVERFPQYKTDTFLACYTTAYNIEISDKADVISTFYYEGTETPAAYLYENENGQRFMVYGFVYSELYERSGNIFSYCRGRQINDSMEWLGGKKMPVECNGHPKLYCICKENESGIAAGYFNFHEDEINDAEVIFEKKPSKVEFINCDGIKTENGVIIKHMKAFGFAGILIHK